MRKRTAYFGFASVALAAAAIVLYASAQGGSSPPRTVQRACEDAGGVLYTARDTPGAPAICHKKGPAVSTDEPLWEWETVLFVEGQL